MKKLLILFFLLIASTGYSQVSWTDTTASIGLPDHNVSQSYPLPVRLYGSNVTEKELVTVSFAFEDTTDNVIDTLSRLINDTANSLQSVGFTTAYKMTIYSIDTTVQFSPDIIFPTNQIYRSYSLGSWNAPERYDVSVFDNWYIRSPNTGVHTYYVVVEGY